MKKILMTGGTGFIGRNIRVELSQKYSLICPSRSELNLLDEAQVYKYLQMGKFDIILHSANPNPVKNSLDLQETMMADSMRIFMNLYRCNHLYGKMFFFGSGAEYDKRRNLVGVSEEDILASIPQDTYGLSKLYMNQLARASENIYNLRLFGCYGPFDHESKFLTHVIRCCLRKEPVTIRQDCRFDYLHVKDLPGILEIFFEQNLRHHDYNICSGTGYLLTELAEIVQKEMGSKSDIRVLKEGLNQEYTASNNRMLEELPEGYCLTSMEDGIRMQIQHERDFYGKEVCHIS